MKRFFLMAAALAFLAGCSEKPVEPVTPPVDPDDAYIEFDSEADYAAFYKDEGDFELTVYSLPEEWTLTPSEDYDWVSADVLKGNSGDVVTFHCSENDGTENKVAEFTFKAGPAEMPFTVYSYKYAEGEAPSLSAEVLSYEVGHVAGELTVVLNVKNLVITEQNIAIVPADDWLTLSGITEGEGENQMNANFTYTVNEGLADRTAEVTVTAPDVEPVTVSVIQKPEAQLDVEQLVYKLDVAGGELTIPVTANVEYEITYSEGAEEWLTQHTTQENVEKWVYTAWTIDGKRSATITFTEKNPVGGAEPLQVVVTVTQSNSIISMVADMNNARAHFADPDAAKNSQALKLGLNATFEALVKLPDGTSGINTIMGTESRFLLRYGDAANKLELVLARATTSQWGGPLEYKLIGTANMPTGRWIHVAATIESKSDYTTETIIYIDGEVYASGKLNAKDANTSDLRPIDLSEREVRGGQEDNHFALGWSYDNGRFWRGLMSEVRVWNRALTQDELKAQNHFYTVPANSEGLVCYWKLDNVSDGLFKDQTSNGNDLRAQKFDGTWTDGHTLTEVELPE